MRILFFDSTGGASGDMILAALTDLGADLARIRRALAGLRVEPFEIRSAPFSSHGLQGTRINVILEPECKAKADKRHAHSKQERGLREIRELIQNAGLPDKTVKMSLNIFKRLAEAEAKVHGIKPGQVHFHEVGAVDSIIDITGACLAVEMMDVDEVAVGVLPLGHGTTTCRHGTIPVPVPATMELLKGMRVTQTDEPFELVTPTGAALLSTWKTMDRPPDGSRLVASGCGFGRRLLAGRPNLIRAYLFEHIPEAGCNHDECLVLECNVDDCQPEFLGTLTGKLLEAGALEAFTTPVFMKKQRPGVLLTVLCAPDVKVDMMDLIFRESTTFGIREYPVNRTVLERSMKQVETDYGSIRIKEGTWQGGIITRSPEYEDCLKLAKKEGISARAVYEAAIAASIKQIKKPKPKSRSRGRASRRLKNK